MKKTQNTQINFNETKLITITNSQLSPGYCVVQSCHSLADFSHEFPEQFKDWKESSNSIICLEAKSEEHLLNIYEKFKDLTPSVIFFEPDIDQYTSICLYGTPDIRKKLASLPLILKNKKEEVCIQDEQNIIQMM